MSTNKLYHTVYQLVNQLEKNILKKYKVKIVGNFSIDYGIQRVTVSFATDRKFERIYLPINGDYSEAEIEEIIALRFGFDTPQ